jgi:hypothetical protein
MNPRAVGIRCVVAMGKSERVSVRVELRGPDDMILDALSARMGVTLWRQIVLPALRTFAVVSRLTCAVEASPNTPEPPTADPGRQAGSRTQPTEPRARAPAAKPS